MRIVLFSLALAACAQQQQPADSNGVPPADNSAMPLPPGEDAAGTRPAGQPDLATYRGTFAKGTECPTLTLEDGRMFSLSVAPDAYAEGATLEVVGELADASYCMAGEGTIIPDRVAVVE